MVSCCSVIMCLTWFISEIQVTKLVNLRQKVEYYEYSCTTGQYSPKEFLDLAPCPPPGKTHLICDIPANITCQERTHILQNCIIYLTEAAITRTFITCNQSSKVQCVEFVNLCKNVSKFNCGTPQSIKPSTTTVPPHIVTSPVGSINRSDTSMNKSDITVNGGRPEVPVVIAGSRNWWPLLALLVIPIVVILVCFVYCRRKRSQKDSPVHYQQVPKRSPEVNILKDNRVKKRDSFIGQGDKFKKVPYIDGVVNGSDGDSSTKDDSGQEIIEMITDVSEIA
ncbi:uncharacterized protein LOC133174078 [Saccostrea echinata]|uniref:uncharacterized protein LOC133174078 n=1 Tax=Saccostrea echinata TaxID=191078 RepID=UPI002A839FCA|nr:uncharacterized protein LOC133174078 [Saccostrea echinata]